MDINTPGGQCTVQVFFSFRCSKPSFICRWLADNGSLKGCVRCETSFWEQQQHCRGRLHHSFALCGELYTASVFVSTLQWQQMVGSSQMSSAHAHACGYFFFIFLLHSVDWEVVKSRRRNSLRLKSWKNNSLPQKPYFQRNIYILF